MYNVLGILLCHTIADFVVQTDWQAKNKSKRWDALTLHVSTYTLTMMVGVCLVLRSFEWSGLWIFVTFATHFLTDAITSRISSRMWAQSRPHAFFVVVGFDQWIHMATLLLTAQWLKLL